MAGLPPGPMPPGPAPPGRTWTGWLCSLGLHAVCLAAILGFGRFVAVQPVGGGGGDGGCGGGMGVIAVDLGGLGTGGAWPDEAVQASGAAGMPDAQEAATSPAETTPQPAESEPPRSAVCQSPAVPIPEQTPKPKPTRKSSQARRLPGPQQSASPVDIAATGNAPASGAHENQPTGGMSPGGPSGPGTADGGPGAGTAKGSGGGEGQGHGPGSGSGRGIGEEGGMDLAAVDEKPRIARQVEPEYPETARRCGVGGRVVARFLVTAEGHVSRVSIVSAQPPGIFDAAVRAALEKWKFRPARFKGREVAAWVMLPIRFDLKK